MNRLVSVNTGDVVPDDLPPLHRQGPVRVLFIHTNIYGFRSIATHLKDGTARRDDIDAVHIDLEAPWWVRASAKSIPGSRGWDLHEYRYWLLWGRIMRRWLRGSLDLSHFDVVHVMTQGVAGQVAERARETDTRFVLRVDFTSHQLVSDYGFNPVNRAPFARAERRMFDAADLIGCDSQWTLRALRDLYGVPEHRSVQVPFGVTIPVPERTPRPNGPVRIAYVANGWRRKGGDLVLAAHQRRLADRAELHMIGTGHEVDETARNVVWHGPVSRSELDRLWPTMDVFTLGSRLDMLPQASIEAASHGLALVLPRVGALPELASDGHGVLFEPGDIDALADALRRVVDDDGFRTALGAAAQRRARAEHDAHTVVPEWLDRVVDLTA